MSRWLPEQLQIVLHPRQLLILRLSRDRVPRVLDKTVLSTEAAIAGESDWNPVLQTLTARLDEFHRGRAEVNVVLSNHFLRYLIFNNSENITRVEEEQALVQHRFTQIYGKAAAKWAISLSSVERFDLPRVACAMEQELLQALRDTFTQKQLTLRSLQPYLTSIYNQHRASLKPDCWLALVEDGILCLAHLQAGHWQTIKSCRISSDWRRELAVTLQREILLAACAPENPHKAEPVMVFAPDYPEPVDVTKACQSDHIDDPGTELVLDQSLWPEPTQVSETVQAMAVYG